MASGGSCVRIPASKWIHSRGTESVFSVAPALNAGDPIEGTRPIEAWTRSNAAAAVGTLLLVGYAA
jgi:hypothetical protein